MGKIKLDRFEHWFGSEKSKKKRKTCFCGLEFDDVFVKSDENEDECESSVQLWTLCGILITPLDTTKLISFLESHRIEEYEECVPDSNKTVILRLDNGLKYQLRFKLLLHKLEFIDMFRVPR